MDYAYFVRLPSGLDGMGDTWKNFFEYAKERYSSTGGSQPHDGLHVRAPVRSESRRIDCLRIQTDIILMVYYILFYKSVSLGLTNYMSNIGLEDIVYRPNDITQQTVESTAVPDLFNLINQISNNVLNATKYFKENYNFQPLVSDYSKSINGSILHGVGPGEFFGNLINISGPFTEDKGPNLLIPLFVDMLDDETNVEEAVKDYENGNRYLGNLIEDTHAFTLFIDEMGQPFIFDPHMSEEGLLELSQYSLIPENKKFLLYVYRKNEDFTPQFGSGSCNSKNMKKYNKLKKKKSKRLKSKKLKSKRLKSKRLKSKSKTNRKKK